VLFAAFAAALPGFLTYGNIITLIRSVAVLGILAVAMAIVIIGRGIDLSLIAVMAVSTALAFTLMAVCTENLSSDVFVVKSAKDGV
jgi:ribose transport system permease protein